MATEFSIKDASGEVILDLSKRITYFNRVDLTIIPTGGKMPTKVIDLGSSDEKDKIWFYVDLDGLGLSGKKVIAPVISLVFGTKEDIMASSIQETKEAIKNYPSGRTYLLLVDSRGGYNVSFEKPIRVVIGRY